MKLEEVIQVAGHARRPLLADARGVIKWLVCSSSAYMRDPSEAFAVYLRLGGPTDLMAKQSMVSPDTIKQRIGEYKGYSDWEPYGNAPPPIQYIVVFSKL
jgi:hypothetical protein